jgi:organic radical activating enzyme
MPRGELSKEADEVAVMNAMHRFEKYEELPLVSTGCDSYASWHPDFKNLSPVRKNTELAEDIVTMLPFKEWRDEHLVITGGEPLLGWQRAYPSLLDDPKMAGLREITFETNGTQELTTEFRKYLLNWTLGNKTRGREALTFSVSAKLPCSGEKWSEAIRPEIVCQYEDVGHTYLKLVISTKDDFADAERAVAEYRAAGFRGHVYLMPIGGVESVYALNNRNVAILAMNEGWRYSDRLQVPLFKNEWGT